MSNNIFDSDSDCGADIDNNNYPTELDSSFIPDDLYYNTQKISRVQNEVERLKVQTYGGQAIKYRYWKMEDCKPIAGTYIWLSGLVFFEHSKTFFNGNQTDNSDCVSEDIIKVQRELNSFTTTITTSVNSLGAPSWWATRFGASEPVGDGYLIDENIYSSGRYYIGNVSGKKMTFTIDFGAGKKYALSAIRQRGARFPNQVIGSFVLYARNNTTDAWTKICVYENLADPIACGMSEDPVLKYYGSNAPYYTVTKPNLYIEGGNIFVYKPTSGRDSFPIDLKPMWGAEQAVKKFRYYKVCNVYPRGSRLNLNMELYEGGGMYTSGRQYYPGIKVNDQIKALDDDNGGSTPYTAYLFKDTRFYASFGSNNSDDGVEIDFGECNKKALTGLRQHTGSAGLHMTGFDVWGRNTTSEDWEVLSRFGQAPGYDGAIVELEDPWNYSDDGTSEYYAILQTGRGNVAFPGDAAPMWYHPQVSAAAAAVNSRVQKIHILDYTNTQYSVDAYKKFDTENYTALLVYDSDDPLHYYDLDSEYGLNGFNNFNYFYIGYHHGRYAPGDFISLEINVRIKNAAGFGAFITGFIFEEGWPGALPWSGAPGDGVNGTLKEAVNWIPTWPIGDIGYPIDGYTPSVEWGGEYTATVNYGMSSKNLRITLSSHDDGISWDATMYTTMLWPAPPP